MTLPHLERLLKIREMNGLFHSKTRIRTILLITIITIIVVHGGCFLIPASLNPSHGHDHSIFPTDKKITPNRSGQTKHDYQWMDRNNRDDHIFMSMSEEMTSKISTLCRVSSFRKFTDSISANLIDIITMQNPKRPPTGFRRIRTQFIAALGKPGSSQGDIGKMKNQQWGLWTVDPGPRGSFLKDYEFSTISRGDRKHPAGWVFDPEDFWIEEYGRIMEKPSFPIPNGRYWVTGGRSKTAILTINEKKTGGRLTSKQTWKLDSVSVNIKEKEEDETTVILYDVTHLPCRAARYKPNRNRDGELAGSPANANLLDFPVTPGASMPNIKGCKKQDFAVLFVIGVEDI